MSSIHQVNHPGTELNISYRARNNHKKDYYFYNYSQSQGVRLWNRCIINGKNNSHKRKFMEVEGRYVDSIEDITLCEKSGKLRFWGEYEGHSEFELIPNSRRTEYWNEPYAVHKPFLCFEGINDQNTDPYVFGDTFYYAVCKKGDLKNIQIGDIILFGSEFGSNVSVKFYLDTLFVVSAEQPGILKNDLYSVNYQESTLKRLNYSNCSRSNLPIHLGMKYSPNEIYSFFPTKLAIHHSFGRPVIDTISLGLQAPGARTGSKSRRLGREENLNNLWNQIASSVLSQGFFLGTHANELQSYNQLPVKPL
jgi:hypothetical protein